MPTSTAIRYAIGCACLVVLSLPLLQHLVACPAFDLIEHVLRLQCHHLPERCWIVAGAPMAVCSRCAGIYLGIGFAMALSPPHPRRFRPLLAVAVVGAVVLSIEVALEMGGVLSPVHAVRSLVGFALAYPASRIVALWLAWKAPKHAAIGGC